MTAYDYSIPAATATRLLTRFGQSLTLRHYTTGTYDPTTGANTVTTSDSTVIGALLDFGPGQTNVRGNLIQGGDKRLLLTAATAPHLQDHFIIGGIEYVMISLGEINPAGTAVMYDLHLRV